MSIDLMEGIATDAEEKATDVIAEGQEHSEDKASWYWAEDVPGDGDKPEFMLDKYTSVYEQAKAYKELQSKFGGFKGAPEEYDFSELKESGIDLDKESELTRSFLEICKSNNVSQEFASKLMEIYGKDIKRFIPPSRDEIFKKYGESAPEVAKKIGTWGSNVLSTEEVGVLSKMITSAEALNVLEKLRASKSNINAPPGPSESKSYSRTAEQISNEITSSMVSGKYEDINYRNALLRELEQVSNKK